MILNYTATAYSMRNWSDEKRIENNINAINELAYLNSVIGKLVIIFLKKKLKLIIENPYDTQHFLNRYWCIKSKIIDYDRSRDGDFYTKPTQYWFINCEPRNNYVNDKLEKLEKRNIKNTRDQVFRSIISNQYARRFIKKYVIEYDHNQDEDKSEEKSMFDLLL